MKAIALIIFVPIWMVASQLWRGYVLCKIWGWFIVPTFKLPVLQMPAAIGMALVIGFLTYQYIDTQKEEESHAQKIGKGVGVSVLLPAFTLFMGWVVKHWMP